LTDASDEEILKVFKAMGEEDGIIVKKDGEDIHLSDSGTDAEYLVKLGESMEEELDEMMDLEEMDEMDITGSVIDAIFGNNEMGEDIDME
jgi:predicted house-cleaning noncanonical NTP pyrophosphatase (MazG superfamily)